MKLGLVIGRFQPLHNGHVNLIKQALKNNDQVLVLVGSQNKLEDYQNPFTAEERINLISSVFGEEPKLKGIDDYPTNEQWIEDVTSRVITMQEDPSKVTLYTSEKDSAFYRTNFLYSVEERHSGGLSATGIRAALYDGRIADTWLPEETVSFLEEYMTTDAYLRIKEEYDTCVSRRLNALESHAFGNPIEPVSHAVVLQDNKVLLVKRNGSRGYGQWAVPGGYINHDETTRAAALRELYEETSIDLINVDKARELAMCVEENIDDLSVRTLGINYLYAVHKDVELNPVAGDDADEVQWVSLEDILNGNMPLFYNHVTVIRRLLAEYNKKGVK